MKQSCNTRTKGLFILAMVIISFALVMIFIPATPQPLSYHDFADARSWLGIPNFANVVSNAAFFIPGVIGLWLLISRKNLPTAFINPVEKVAFYVLFGGAFLVAFGSGYYHLNPNNNTLVWDRIPIAVIEGAIIAIFLADRINARIGIAWLFPVVILGVLSVLYWYHTELLDHGDLRLYGWYQAMSVLIVILLVALFPARYTSQYYLLEGFVLYGLGRLGELWDKPIYQLTDHLVSGHTLKHVLMGVALYSFVRYLRHRKPT